MRVFRSAGKRIYFTLLASSFMFPIQAFAQCVDNEDCVSLGYNKTSCKTPGLKCPFGEYYYCLKDCEDGYEWKDGACQPKEPEGAVLGECTGYAKNCKIGDILNSDGTCSSYKDNTKTQIGVVVYISEEGCGQAMTANPIGKYVWGGYDVDIPDLPNVDAYTKTEDFDSCGNTQKIVQTIGNTAAGSYSAAVGAVNYSPQNLASTRGKWCLPAAGVLQNLADNINTVNKGISEMGGAQFPGETLHMWSSSEVDAFNAIYFSATNISIPGREKNSTFDVRPVIEF